MWIALLGFSLLIGAIWFLLMQLNKTYFILSLCKRVRTADGSPLESKVFVIPGKTRFGNNLDLLNLTPATIFNYIRESTAQANGQNYIWNFLFAPEYNIVRAEDAEEIFQSTKITTKNMAYELIRPFLGDGLLISIDQKWHSRRKTLTPAFHFNILQSFLSIFKEESKKFITILDKNVGCELELNQIQNLPEDIDKISMFQFNELIHLECVIKESLRLFPSAPIIGRTCMEESVVNGLVLPKNAQISIHIYDIMRDPRHFPKPNQFLPERFLPENAVNRHPFAFVPFSAGPRNCIGQKFGILEMKVLLAAVIRNYKLLPATQLEDLTFENGIVLRTQQNIKVKFEARVK